MLGTAAAYLAQPRSQPEHHLGIESSRTGTSRPSPATGAQAAMSVSTAATGPACAEGRTEARPPLRVHERSPPLLLITCQLRKASAITPALFRDLLVANCTSLVDSPVETWLRVSARASTDYGVRVVPCVRRQPSTALSPASRLLLLR
jgi:hypothetical protein